MGIRGLATACIGLLGLVAAPAMAGAIVQPAVDLARYGGATANSRATSGAVVVLQDPARAVPRLRGVTLTRRMSLLYVTDLGVVEVVDSSGAMRTLPWLFRQEPSSSVGAAALAGNDQRVSKVSGNALAAAGSAAEIAAILRAAIDKSCTTPAGVSTCTAHRVTVDEITPRFGGVGGRSAAGRRLNAAMSSLTGIQSPWGGSYASRVEFLMAPAVSTSVTAGLGPYRTLGRDGRVHRRDYRDAFDAMSRSGGVWIEAYHFTRSRTFTAFTEAEWRDVPVGVATFLRKVTPGRNPLEYLHVMLTDVQGAGSEPGPACSTPGTPGGPALPDVPACPPVPEVCAASTWSAPSTFPAYGGTLLQARAQEVARITRMAGQSLLPVTAGPVPLLIAQPGTSPMQCQWLRAQTGAVNARILANGPGAFRVSGLQALTFGRLFRQFFMVP